MDTCGVKFRRAVSVLAVGLGLIAAGCSGSDGSDDGKPLREVETDVELSDGEPGVFELSGPEDSRIVAQGTGLRQSESGDQVKVTFSAVSDACDNANFFFYLPIAEGETGTYETVKTPQFTCKRSQYSTEGAIRATIETYGDGRFVGAVKGSLEQKTTDGGRERANPALEVEGRFDFEYGEE
jgi:hypothetical protein